MGEKQITWCFASKGLSGKVLEVVGKLCEELSIRVQPLREMNTHCLKVCSMAAEATWRLTPLIFQLIIKIQVQQPELCMSEWCEVSGIRPKHYTSDKPGKVTSRFRKWLLQLLVSLNNGFGSVKFSIYSYVMLFVLHESTDLRQGQGLLTLREVLMKRHCVLNVRLRWWTRDEGTESQPDELWIHKTDTVIV